MNERRVINRADATSAADSETLLLPFEDDAEAPDRQPDVEKSKPEQAPSPRRGRWPWVLVLLAVALLGVGAWRILGPKGASEKPAGQQVQPVGAAKIGVGDLNETLSGLGTVTPLATVTVQTQINGQMMSVGFKEGRIVQKGDFLAQIDPRPFQAALDQAEGTLAHDKGLLDQAQSDLQRFVKLGREDSIAQQQVADQQFLVEQDKGTVRQDEAAVETAKINLDYCHIVSPITGRVGLRLVDPGNYLQTATTTGIAVLAQVQPISVVFVIPEDQIDKVWPQFKSGTKLTVTAYSRDDAKLIATGSLESIDNEIDTTTGTVKLRATFPNTDEALFPNQFVNARIVVQKLSNVTVAPVAAIQHGAPGTFVFLVNPGGAVAVQKVSTGITDGDQIQILSGLKSGDIVVVDGADRLREGAKVRIAPDEGDSAANLNNGPGAPPGEQPSNAAKVPPALKVQPSDQKGAPQPAGSSPSDGR
jgi:multidrug efflux system membrane fusion protein